MPTTEAASARLRTRGTIVPGCDLIMAVLQVLHPRRMFPADNLREPVLDPKGWQRGGTSPGGAAPGGVEAGRGNYFIGDPELAGEAPPPQRVIWQPPGEGGESYAPHATTGYVMDRATDPGLPTMTIPRNPEADLTYREMATHATAAIYSRIIPMQAHVWGHDWDDTEELVHWLASAAVTAFNGNAMNVPIVGGGGWVKDEKGTRGLHYVLTINLAAPIVYPVYDEVKMREAIFRVTGDCGPHNVPPSAPADHVPQAGY